MNQTPLILGIGIILGLLLLSVYLFGLTKRWGILLPFMGLFLFGSIGLSLTWNGRVNPTIWMPIQANRTPLYLVCGIAGILTCLFQLPRLKGKRFSLSAILLLIIGLYAAAMRMHHESPLDGTQSIVVSLLTLIPMMLTASIFLEKPTDLIVLARSVVLTNIVWVGMVFVQIVVNKRYVMMGNENRFVGLITNPQLAGALMAFFLVFVLWLLLNDRRRYMIPLLGLLALDSLLLIWTGSRTGMGMAVIGVCATLYSRAGRAILLLPIAAIITYVGLKTLGNMLDFGMGLERLASTEDTRSGAWRKLIQVAMDNPFLGAGLEGAEKSENSWLYGFASYGIGMLLIQLVFTLVATIEILRSMWARFHVPSEYRNYLDFLNGLMLMYLAGAVFEGYMISRVSSTLCVYMIAAVANVNIRKWFTVNQYDYPQHAEGLGYSDEEQENLVYGS